MPAPMPTEIPAEMPNCPHCDARLMPDVANNRLWCQFCGTVRTDAEARRLLEPYRDLDSPSYEPPTRDWDTPPMQQHRLDIAWRSIQAGDLQSAAILLNDSIQLYPTCADIWYLLSLTTADHRQKIAHLEKALALQPYHAHAWRDKGILEGVLPESAPSDLPDLQSDEAVEARSRTEACPRCGGALAFNVEADALVCGHCGYQPGSVPVMIARRMGHDTRDRTNRRHGYDNLDRANRRYGYDNLDNALLQRRFGFSREWKIGARVLICQNCHAQLTLSGTTFSTLCPFCDSAHILVRDAVGSFEAPDALVPFKIDRAAAAKALHRRIPPDYRARVERGEMWGGYLPFWSFEGAASVHVEWGAHLIGGAVPGVYPAGDVLVGGISRPEQAVLYELMPYDLDDLIPYDPRYLARWSAQIYNIDVIQASLTARAYIKYAARRQAAGSAVPPVELARSDTNDYIAPNTPVWRAAKVDLELMRYRLLLLPVWMITLILRDRTHRPAIVNGQTGEAVLSASFAHPERLVAGPNRPPIEPLPVIRPLTPRPTVIRPLKPRG